MLEQQAISASGRCEVLHHNHDSSSALRPPRNVHQQWMPCGGPRSICRVPRARSHYQAVCGWAAPAALYRDSRRSRWASPLSLSGGRSRDDARRDRSGHARRHRCDPRCRWGGGRISRSRPRTRGWRMELLRALTAARYRCRTARVATRSATSNSLRDWEYGPSGRRPSLDGLGSGCRRHGGRWTSLLVLPVGQAAEPSPRAGPGRVGVWCRCGAPGGAVRRTCAAGPRSFGRWSARRRGPAGRGAAGRGR